MKTFCTIMTIIFITMTVLMAVGCIFEWSGDGVCKPCGIEHVEGCGFHLRARLHSLFTTVTLAICSIAWGVLLWEAYAPDREMSKLERHVRGNTDFNENMRNGYEKRNKR